MSTVDTLKLARALRDRGGFTQDAADATAEAINAALGQEVATKSDIKLLDSRITALDSRIVMLMWIVGINLTLLFGIGGPLLWLMLRIAAKVGAL